MFADWCIVVMTCKVNFQISGHGGDFEARLRGLQYDKLVQINWMSVSEE